MMRAGPGALAALVTAGALASGQAFTDIAAGDSRIAGIVVDADHDAPLADAVVSLYDFDRGAAARRTTAADGRFAFDGIAAGLYRVHVRRTGFVEQIFGSDFPVGTEERRLSLAPGARRDDLRFALQPAATVRGRVTDNGRPVAGALVLVGRLDTHHAPSSVAGVAPAGQTGPDGRFEVGGLPGGTWHVEAYAAGSASADDTGEPAAFARTFYPGVTRPELAVPVHVSPGASVDGIDVPLSRARFFSLTLKIDPALSAGTSDLEVVVTSLPPGTKFAFDRRAVLEDGTVHLFRLRPGRYVAWARATVAGRPMAASEVLDVRDDVGPVVLRARPTGRLEGRIVAGRATSLAFDGLRVIAALAPEGDEPDPLSPDDVAVAPDGTFAVGGLFGPRVLRVVGLPAGWTVREIRRGGRPVPGPLTTGPAQTVSGIEIEVRPPG